MINIYVIYGLVIMFFLGFMGFIVLIGLFWKIMLLQLKYWTLAKKGYIKIEHVGEDKVIRTYFLKPKEDKFDIEGGFFAFQKDALVKDEKMFATVNKELLSKKPEEQLTGEEKEYKRLLQSIGKMKFDHDAVSLNWGVPTMIYYGQDINPIKPSERKKIYDAKIFSALYMRLLLLKEWKFIRMAFIVIMVCMIIVAGVQMGLFFATSKVGKTNSQCMSALNYSIYKYEELVNKTLIPAYEQRQKQETNVATGNGQQQGTGIII